MGRVVGRFYLHKEQRMIENNLKVLGLPVALAVVLSGVALLFGIDLALAVSVAGTLLGMAALIALVINVLKWAGVVSDGVAGKLQAAANLLVLAVVAVALRWYPDVDLHAIDIQIADFVVVASLLFAWFTQVV